MSEKEKRSFPFFLGFILIFSIALLFSVIFISHPNYWQDRISQKESPTPVSMKNTSVYNFDDPEWWDHAVFYEIFVRSFYDSDGDGIGDLNGITEKLDYLNDGNPETTTDLGITAIWLMPIYPSPSYHGYDVTDYYSINPEYGTIEDFEELLGEAHERGIHVIVDFVVNHTSIEHPWFIASKDIESEYHDWYIWSETDPGYLGPWGEKVWFPVNSKYYYGVFWEGMPDLNYENEDVTAEIRKAASFWINDMGVDGFRIDGAKHLIEDGKVQTNSKATYAWFTDFLAEIKSWNPRAMTVGEVWDESKIVLKYLDSKDFDMTFNFNLATAIVEGVSSGQGKSLSSSVNVESFLFKDYSIGTFLSNHDMERVMSQLGNKPELAKNAATILFTIPGTPFIYYGEEIGMTGKKPDEMIRTPMQWSTEDNGGFTTGSAWERVNADFPTTNAAVESADENSILSHYRRLIQLKLQHSAFIDGEYIKVDSSNPQIYSGLRVSESGTILTVVNLKNTAIENIVLKIKEPLEPGVYIAQSLIPSSNESIELEVIRDGEFAKITLPIINGNENIILQLSLKPLSK